VEPTASELSLRDEVVVVVRVLEQYLAVAVLLFDHVVADVVHVLVARLAVATHTDQALFQVVFVAGLVAERVLHGEDLLATRGTTLGASSNRSLSSRSVLSSKWTPSPAERKKKPESGW
jgi:hypothetical protein